MYFERDTFEQEKNIFMLLSTEFRVRIKMNVIISQRILSCWFPKCMVKIHSVSSSLEILIVVKHTGGKIIMKAMREGYSNQ